MMRALLFLSLLCLPFFSFADDYFDCDVNHDGEVNIADVNRIIDAILKGPSVNPPSSDSEMFTVNGVSFTMIKVEGGTFVMGATEEQGAYSGYAKALPIHHVNLSGYSIGQTEVTQELWIAVMGSNPSHFGSGYSNNLQRPVEMVSWNDCQTFINRLNELTGRQFHLPTEE